MSKVSKRTKRIAITTSVMLALGGGAAIAYWSATGKGAVSTSTAGTSAAFIVEAAAGQAGGLTPGGDAATVNFTVKHNGTGVQQLNLVEAIVANADGTAWTTGAGAGCSAADFAVSTATIAGGYGIIAEGATKEGSVTVTMVNRDSNQDDCKGVQVPLYFTAR